MKKILLILLYVACSWVTAVAQDLSDQRQGFTFTRNNNILTAQSPDGCVQSVDLNSPAFKGKAIAFTYSAKKKTAYQEPEKMSYQVRIFPNPASERIKLELDGEWSFPVKAQLFDKNGNLIKASNLETNGAMIDVSQCRPGMYIIRLQASNTSAMHKLLIQ